MATDKRRKAFDIETSRAIGERIRGARGSRSQAEFADAIGVSRTALTNYEAGRRLPNDQTLGKIAEVGGTTVPSLLFGPATKVPFGDYIARIEEGAIEASQKRPGFIPRFAISDDELALIALSRLYLDSEGLGFVRQIVEFWEGVIASDKQLPGMPPIVWGEAHVARLRDAISRGQIETGYDPEFQLWVTLWEEKTT